MITKQELDEARGAAIDIANSKADMWIVLLEVCESLSWYMETGACSCDVAKPCGHCRARMAMSEAEPWLSAAERKHSKGGL